jgi:hypothetical protein
MADGSFHVRTTWRVQAKAAEVYEVLAGVLDMRRWWPAVVRDALEIPSGAPAEESLVYRITTRGWMPYVMRWHFRITHAQPPVRLGIEAWGDIEGRMTWTLQQVGREVNAYFDAELHLNKPPLKALRRLYEPLFATNFRWAMAQGEASLRLEIDRRHTREQDVRLLPAPPPPAPIPWKSIFLGLSVIGALFVVRRKRRKWS